MRKILAALMMTLISAGSSPVFSQKNVAARGATKEGGQPCPPGGAPLPLPFSAWKAPPAQAMAANDEESASATLLSIGRVTDLSLREGGKIRFAMPPQRQAGEARYGGLARLSIKRAGLYRIATDQAVWIDLIAGGKALTSTGHGHGPTCTGIHKMVDFRLKPGDYLIQIAGGKQAKARLMVAFVPDR